MRSLAVLATSLTLLLAACGGGDDEGISPEGQGENSGAAAETEKPAGEVTEGDTVQVRMQKIKFVPAEASVKVGQTVRWVNEDSVDHDVKAVSGADFASELFGKGGEFEWEAEKAGMVTYLCTVHAGMSGTLLVMG